MGKKQQKHQTLDQILGRDAMETNPSSPTQHPTLDIGGKEISNVPTGVDTNLTISLPNSSSLAIDIDDHFSFADPEPTSKSDQKSETGCISKKRENRKDSKSKPDNDDDGKVESRREELHFHDKVFEDNAEKDHSSTPKFDGISGTPTTKNGDPGSKSPSKEQKDGSTEIGKRRVGNGNIARKKAETSSATRQTSTKVFTEDDEIILLQGTIDCGLLHNVPASSVSASVLHELLDGIFHSDFNRTQIYEKMRRLKKKFVKNMKLFESSGSDASVFLKPHEAMTFELSMKIWGGTNGDHNNPNARDNRAQERTLVEDDGDRLKGKNKSSTGKKSLAGGSCVTEAAAALDALMDGDGHDNNGEIKVQIGNDENGNGKVSMKKRRLLEEIDRVTKKIELMLEVAKLELDELKNGSCYSKIFNLS